MKKCLGGRRLALVALLGLGLAAVASGQTITEFAAGITAFAFPSGITAGPDGNLWFTENNTDRIGRITVASSFYTLTPCRIIDTRNPVGPYGGPAIAHLGTRDFTLADAAASLRVRWPWPSTSR